MSCTFAYRCKYFPSPLLLCFLPILHMVSVDELQFLYTKWNNDNWLKRLAWPSQYTFQKYKVSNVKQLLTIKITKPESPGKVQQRVPCERARQLLEPSFRHEVSLAVATVLCRGKRDWRHPSCFNGDLSSIQTHNTKYIISYNKISNLRTISISIRKGKEKSETVHT